MYKGITERARARAVRARARERESERGERETDLNPPTAEICDSLEMVLVTQCLQFVDSINFN